MINEPSGAALIEAARRALSEEVLPGLAGRPRYVALMVANALGIAAREIAQAGATDAAGMEVLAGAGEGGDPLSALTRALREGHRDADPALYAALTRQAEVAAQVWKPRG